MNLKLRLAEEGEMEGGAASGRTLEFVLENDEVLLKDQGVEELREKQQSEQQQSCTEDSDRTQPSQIPDS